MNGFASSAQPYKTARESAVSNEHTINYLEASVALVAGLGVLIVRKMGNKVSTIT